LCYCYRQKLYFSWCGDIALKNAFSNLYDIARAKDAHVKDHMEIYFLIRITWKFMEVSFSRM